MNAASSDNLHIHEINEVNIILLISWMRRIITLLQMVITKLIIWGDVSFRPSVLNTRPLPSNQQRYQPRYPPRKTYQLFLMEDWIPRDYLAAISANQFITGHQTVQIKISKESLLIITKINVPSGPPLWSTTCFMELSQSDMPPPPPGYDISPNNLFQNDYDHPLNLKGLVAESWTARVLDNGATKTVGGRDWFNAFVESLSESDHAKIRTTPLNHFYIFMDANTAVRNLLHYLLHYLLLFLVDNL